MKIKNGFVLRRVMDNYVVVAVGEASKSFRGMLKLNATAAEVWQGIEKGLSESQICDVLCEKYDVEPSVAICDVKKTVEELLSHGFAEE